MDALLVQKAIQINKAMAAFYFSKSNGQSRPGTGQKCAEVRTHSTRIEAVPMH